MVCVLEMLPCHHGSHLELIQLVSNLLPKVNPVHNLIILDNFSTAKNTELLLYFFILVTNLQFGFPGSGTAYLISSCFESKSRQSKLKQKRENEDFF